MNNTIRTTLGILVAISLLLLTACKKEYIHVGENWDFINKMEKPENSFAVSASGPEIAKVGEEMRYSITSGKDGQLWVVQVDSTDELSLLYPNEKEQDNEIKAGQRYTLPPNGADWFIEASEPKGESVVLFVVTSGDVDIADVLTNDKSVAKAMRIVEEAPSWSFARKVVNIK